MWQRHKLSGHQQTRIFSEFTQTFHFVTENLRRDNISSHDPSSLVPFLFHEIQMTRRPGKVQKWNVVQLFSLPRLRHKICFSREMIRGVWSCLFGFKFKWIVNGSCLISHINFSLLGNVFGNFSSTSHRQQQHNGINLHEMSCFEGDCESYKL